MSYTPPNNDSADFSVDASGYTASNNDDADFTVLVDLVAPSNIQIVDASTEGELTLDWDAVSSATGYFVYRAESSGTSKSDYTQIANPTTPPYTDRGLEDGEKYYYRVTSFSNN